MSDDDSDDITRNFHGGNPESVIAKELSRKTAERDRGWITRLTTRMGQYGITCDEAERMLGLSHQTCSARFSELKRDGILLPTLFTRRTRHNAPARVMVVAPLPHRAATAAAKNRKGRRRRNRRRGGGDAAAMALTGRPG